MVKTGEGWAHVEFTPMNIKLTIFRKKIEDLLEARAPHL